MHFLDDSLLPENQEKLVIQVAPYGPQWLPGDSDDIPVSMAAQVQKAVDCRNAGATVLHLHCREPDGSGSKRLSLFNEMIARIRDAVPDMLIQVGGSISFAPESDGEQAKWLDYGTRHMLAELTPRPDQVTIAINTGQMNITELMMDGDIDGTILENPAYALAYRDMVVEAGPAFYLEHLKRLRDAGIQPHFMLANITQLEAVERLIRRGHYQGPLVLNYVAIGGGASGTHPADLIEFVRRTPDGAVLTIESIMRNVIPFNTIAIALGLHVRVGIDRARSLAVLMLALAPLLLAYRLAPGGSPLMLAGMAASVLWFTAAYGPCFAIIEKQLPADLKATATGLNMLLINVLMIGGLGLVIGAASDALARAGSAHSWTGPLLGADVLAMTGIIALLAAGRRHSHSMVPGGFEVKS